MMMNTGNYCRNGKGRLKAMLTCTLLYSHSHILPDLIIAILHHMHMWSRLDRKLGHNKDNIPISWIPSSKEQKQIRYQPCNFSALNIFISQSSPKDTENVDFS